MVTLPKHVAIANTEGAALYYHCHSHLEMDWEAQKQSPASHRIFRRQRAVSLRVFPHPAPWCCSEPLHWGWHTLAGSAIPPMPHVGNTSALKALREFAGRKTSASISVSSHTIAWALSYTLVCYGRAVSAVNVAFSGAGQHSMLSSHRAALSCSPFT